MKDATKQTKCSACKGRGVVQKNHKSVCCFACRGTGKAAGYQAKRG